jgi:hypothetical protein
VQVPVAGAPNPSATIPSHLLKVHAELVSQLPVDGVTEPLPSLQTSEQYTAYIRSRTAAWRARSDR